MYVSDKKIMDYFSMALIVCLPWFCTSWVMWSWIWEMVILMAVLWIGWRTGLKWTAIYLLTGYGLAAISFHGPGLQQMGYVPWAGLITVYGLKKDWPLRFTFFWSIVAAGLLGAIPIVIFPQPDLQSQDFLNSLMTQYESKGLLPALQEQGITEPELRTMLEQVLQVYARIIPALAAVSAIAEFSLICYFFLRWSDPLRKKRVPFSFWRLPWYAVWGVIAALICYLLGDELSWLWLSSLGLNLLVVYAAVTSVVGISVYVFFLRSPHVPRLVKWMLILGNVLYFYYSWVSIILFGLFDLVFNFRRLPEGARGK
ncbi:MAG TPA: DUF2232 domain-containing protein [Desulfitobacteriaceae bacterium]|nr:DUF2232 domain-containing protein [Desulfitobacteriaceae bacterium]